ncbi:hypothetical protein A3I95_02830 [Candidatus Nomurabacteria bacterium RIFCSPLOWO2_02_FULL_44_12]|uniref:DUF4352 domain-containing protein n=1 Tax=Candidatus Nomurabacteria bacterium RIFCSPLOWO2_12_FULL_44_11 TaxID=1801796 RepID=A0A1F6Y7Q5_9BACT|nr:MAG: hypothetical protein A3E95_02530 [Candidatus Nomurabacteria bacterium RIFCSPHIGHO2_12_FULL_44_22b]OGJ02407.1 MAG: hypothetical protein A3G53_00860 [Candidatus Nomurabacteria bacterium RIFCSPLOWO2_12_FULL_44_11]OGJ08657.1 MAG: hypothetical protein A3I95_02830 [Candidatus Nomurabacteria bacterium RIFCSPLOWO2_02_FULL_44_12]
MKIKGAFILLVAVAGGIFLFYRGSSVEEKTSVLNQANGQTSGKQNWESKTDEQAAITVTVTPLDISPQSEEWKFNIIMNTHSVELNQDMTKIVVLLDDQGKEYKPLRWEGAEAGGHHREGILIWGVIVPMPKSVEIRIKDIGEIPERSFKWNTE